MRHGTRIALAATAAAVLLSSALPVSAAAFSDNFNRADSTDLGPGWTEVAQTTLAISSNKLTNPPASTALATAVGGTGNSVEADVTATAASTMYAALVLNYASVSNNIFVKVQDNGNGTLGFDTAWFYVGNNGAPFSSFIVLPDFTSARMKVSIAGSDVTLTLDTNFDNVADITHVATGAPNTGGTGIGAGIYGGATIDNFQTTSLDPAECAPGAPVPAGYNLIEGGSGNDTLAGTSGKDLIRGLGGSDVIRGFAGADVLCGNDGNDTLYGGSGNDVLSGGTGTDTLNGDSGTDRGIDADGDTTRVGIEQNT